MAPLWCETLTHLRKAVQRPMPDQPTSGGLNDLDPLQPTARPTAALASRPCLLPRPAAGRVRRRGRTGEAAAQAREGWRHDHRGPGVLTPAAAGSGGPDRLRRRAGAGRPVEGCGPGAPAAEPLPDRPPDP